MLKAKPSTCVGRCDVSGFLPFTHSHVLPSMYASERLGKDSQWPDRKCRGRLHKHHRLPIVNKKAMSEQKWMHISGEPRRQDDTCEESGALGSSSLISRVLETKSRVPGVAWLRHRAPQKSCVFFLSPILENAYQSIRGANFLGGGLPAVTGVDAFCCWSPIFSLFSPHHQLPPLPR